jgi:S1-C subfamily serine protease
VSGTTGGSSGSPVINLNGNVIALNAGARNDAASSYFLPLDRVVRALKLVAASQPVARGTLETVFKHEYYDELERLGLPADVQDNLRKHVPDATGLLVVSQVQEGGSADGLLNPGDILLSVNDHVLSGFVPLDEMLDDAVGQTLSFKLLRGGVPYTQQLKVEDLNRLSPDSYLEFGGGTFNDLSYQEARSYNVPVHGVYVANPGYAFGTAGFQRGAVITEFNGQAVADIDDFQKALEVLPDGIAHHRPALVPGEPLPARCRQRQLALHRTAGGAGHRDADTDHRQLSALPQQAHEPVGTVPGVHQV